MQKKCSPNRFPPEHEKRRLRALFTKYGRVAASSHRKRAKNVSQLTRLEPAIQSKTSTWSGVSLKKQLTWMSSKLEPAIWSRDTGQWMPCFDRC